MPNFSAMPLWPLACAGLLALSGCATGVEKVTGWLASNAPTIAVMDGRVLRGDAKFTQAREATVQLQSADLPALSCFGPLRHTSTSSGSMVLACSDGRNVTLAFQALSPMSGIANGLASKADGTISTPVVLTFGLPPEKAAGYLGISIDSLVPSQPN